MQAVANVIDGIGRRVLQLSHVDGGKVVCGLVRIQYASVLPPVWRQCETCNRERSGCQDHGPRRQPPPTGIAPETYVRRVHMFGSA